MHIVRILLAVCAFAPTAVSAEDAHFEAEICPVPWVAERGPETLAFEMKCERMQISFQLVDEGEGWGQLLPRAIWGMIKKGDSAICPEITIDVRDADHIKESEIIERYRQCYPGPQTVGIAPEK